MGPFICDFFIFVSQLLMSFSFSFLRNEQATGSRILVSSELCQTILAEWTEGIKVKCYKCFTYHYLYFLPLHVNTTMLEHTVVDLEYSTLRLYFITLFKRVKTKCSSENINKRSI